LRGINRNKEVNRDQASGTKVRKREQLGCKILNIACSKEANLSEVHTKRFVVGTKKTSSAISLLSDVMGSNFKAYNASMKMAEMGRDEKLSFLSIFACRLTLLSSSAKLKDLHLCLGSVDGAPQYK
jgi:hypothetical protein